MPSIGWRIRKRGNKSAKTSMSYYGWPIDCTHLVNTAVTVQETGPIYGSITTMYDEVTPGYFKLRKAGRQLPVNEMRIITSSLEALGSTSLTQTTTATMCTPPVNAFTHWDGHLWCVWFASNAAGTESLITSDRVQNLTAEVETRCMAQRQAGSTNLVESLAELDKTFAMLHHPLENVEKFLRNFRSADSYRRLQKMRRNAATANRRVPISKRGAFLLLLASEWLRFRYGISPLVNDVKAVMKALKDARDIAPKIYTARAIGRIDQSKYTPGVYPTTNWNLLTYTQSANSVTVRSSFRDMYVCTPFIKLGLTFHNVVGVAWELTHFSFVVDWFVNVGDLIYANIPRVNVTSYGGATTTLTTAVTANGCAGYVNNPPYAYVLSGSIGDYFLAKLVVKERRAIHVGGKLVLKDDFRLSNWIRACDAVSLLIQQLSQIRL